MLSNGDEVALTDKVRVSGQDGTSFTLLAGARGVVVANRRPVAVKMRGTGTVIMFAPFRLRKVSPLELLAEQAE